MFVNNEDRIVHALESIADSQMKQTEIAEQCFKEAKELRDITMGMMKRDTVLDKKLKSYKYLDDEERKLLKSELQTPDSNTIEEDIF